MLSGSYSVLFRSDYKRFSIPTLIWKCVVVKVEWAGPVTSCTRTLSPDSTSLMGVERWEVEPSSSRSSSESSSLLLDTASSEGGGGALAAVLRCSTVSSLLLFLWGAMQSESNSYILAQKTIIIIKIIKNFICTTHFIQNNAAQGADNAKRELRQSVIYVVQKITGDGVKEEC